MIEMLKLYTNKFLLCLAFLSSMGAGVMPIIMIRTFGDLLEKLSVQTDFMATVVDLIKELAYINGIMIGVTALSLLFRFIANGPFTVDLRKKLYESFMNIDIEYFDQTSTGELVSRLSEDVTIVKDCYIDKSTQVVQNICMAISGLINMFIESWLTSLITLVVFPLIVAIYFVGDKIIGKIWNEYFHESSVEAATAEEIISQFRTVKSITVN